MTQRNAFGFKRGSFMLRNLMVSQMPMNWKVEKFISGLSIENETKATMYIDYIDKQRGKWKLEDSIYNRYRG